MTAPMRPANRVDPSSRWDSRKASFNLDGLDQATTIAVLRQWALAPHLRAEIVRAERSAEKFARKYGASVNHLRNMCNGHRLIDYSTLALVLAIAGPNNAPDERQIAKEVVDALARSTTKAPPATPSSRTTHYVDISGRTPGWMTAPSGLSTPRTVPTVHPHTELIASAFASAVLTDPLVVAYLDGAPLPEVEVSVFVAPRADDTGAEGFITHDVLGATIWAPADWIETAYAFDNAVAGGFFVCARPAAGSLDTIRAARVVVDAGENPTDWDLVVRDGLASVDLSGELQWC